MSDWRYKHPESNRSINLTDRNLFDSVIPGGEKSNTTFVCLYIAFVVLISLTNVAVIFVFIKMKKKVREKIPNILLFNQAIIDSVIGISTIPRIIFLIHYQIRDAFTVFKFFAEYTIFLAVSVLLIGTIERFCCVKYPFYHQIHATKTKTLRIIAFVFFLTMIPAFVLIFYCEPYKKIFSYYIGAGIVQVTILTFVFILLGITFNTTKKSLRNRIESSRIDSIKNEAVNKSEEKKKFRVTIVFLVMVIIYTLTMLPLMIGNIFGAWFGVAAQTLINIKLSLHLVYLLSSVVNPLLTLMCKPDFTLILSRAIRNNHSNELSQHQSTTSVVESRT